MVVGQCPLALMTPDGTGRPELNGICKQEGGLIVRSSTNAFVCAFSHACIIQLNILPSAWNASMCRPGLAGGRAQGKQRIPTIIPLDDCSEFRVQNLSLCLHPLPSLYHPVNEPAGKDLPDTRLAQPCVLGLRTKNTTHRRTS